MLLRRVIEHVKTQNWTAVGLDFVIVVVGVFIGIQVANWNEARAEAKLGQSYTSRLLADIRRNYELTEIQEKYYETVLKSVEEAEHLLADPDSNARDLVVAAYRASELSGNTINRAVWNQIVSSGHLGLLPDRAIDSGLADYYRLAEGNVISNNLLQDSPYRRTVRSIFPIYVQLAIRSGCSDATNEIQVISGFVAECRLDIHQNVLAELAKELRASPILQLDLRNQYSLVSTVRDNELGNLVLLQRLLNALDPEVGE